ncbi:MAG TPA: type II toxin-antitoxin system death-on-curing family toxin [Polyangiaceae bacterium]|nr:type II toxin-antitoxin system death-on-curing family toxin [Polyangiaceae bacterium]
MTSVDPDDVIYLDVDDVIREHDYQVGASGGAPGVLSLHGLNSAVYQPQQGFGGQDAYPTLAEKAAVYLHGIAKAHAFQDGNKRTALAAALAFLQANGYSVNATDQELQELTEAVTKDSKSRDDAMRFFEDHMQRV